MLTQRLGIIARKQLSTSRRDLHTTLHTIRHPSPTAISEHLASLSLSNTTVGFYLLHPELNDISAILSTVQKGLASCRTTFGSFAQSPKIAQTTAGSTSTDAPFVTIATFTPTSPSEKLVPFRSSLTGRPPASVGRYHRPNPINPTPSDPFGTSSSGEEVRNEDRKGQEVGEVERVLMGSLGYEKGESIGWEGLWRAERLEGMDGPDAQGMGEMKGLEGLREATDVKSMLVLSDGLPNTTIYSLDRHFPSAAKLGLLTEATPFLTGRPHTLFRDQDVFSNGAVGIAFCETETAVRPAFGVDYGNLEPLSGLESIDDAQGNLLLSFHPSIGSSTQNQTNPTQVLIKVLNAFATSTNAQRPSEAGSADSGVVLGKKMKEEEYYLAIWANGDDGTGEPREVVRILSGDPSRGALSLDMEEPLRTGQKVQFMQKSKTAKSNNSSVYEPGMLSFSTLPSEDTIRPPVSQLGDTGIDEGISVGTEGGFFFSPGEQAMSKGKRSGGSVCKVVGARGWMKA